MAGCAKLYGTVRVVGNAPRAVQFKHSRECHFRDPLSRQYVDPSGYRNDARRHWLALRIHRPGARGNENNDDPRRNVCRVPVCTSRSAERPLVLYGRSIRLESASKRAQVLRRIRPAANPVLRSSNPCASGGIDALAQKDSSPSPNTSPNPRLQAQALAPNNTKHPAQGPRPKAQCPTPSSMPKAQCPRPKAQGPMPKAQSPRPNTQHRTPNTQLKAQRPRPNTQHPRPNT